MDRHAVMQAAKRIGFKLDNLGTALALARTGLGDAIAAAARPAVAAALEPLLGGQRARFVARDIADDIGQRAAAMMLRSSVGSVHAMCTGEREPTSMEVMVLLDHLGPANAARTLADVAGLPIGDAVDGDVDVLVTAAEVDQIVSGLTLTAARHRSASSDGGTVVTLAERAIEQREAERCHAGAARLHAATMRGRA